jgi:hypothetical protein
VKKKEKIYQTKTKPRAIYSRFIIARAAVDALQHVALPWLRPSSKSRGTRIALASCHA